MKLFFDVCKHHQYYFFQSISKFYENTAKENYLRIFAIHISITSYKGGLDKMHPSENHPKKFEGGGGIKVDKHGNNMYISSKGWLWITP